MNYSQFCFAQMRLNQVLREIRRAKGLSQKQVADILGIDRSTYSCYEMGKSELDIKTLLALCEIFDIKLDEMLNQDAVLSATSLVNHPGMTYQTPSEGEAPILTLYERRLLHYIRLMNDRQRSDIMDHAIDLLEKGEKK